MPIRVIAISRTTGAGGEAVGLDVAKELGFRYVDEEIIPFAAEKAGVDPDLVADEERRKSLIGRFVESLGAGGMAATAGGAYWIPDDSAARGRSQDFRALIREAVLETATLGDVVILAHAASMALGGRDDVLRVLVTASEQTRAWRLAENTDMDEADAAKAVSRSDVARADYLKRFYGVDHELPTHYDLLLNTDALGLDVAARLVIHAARA
jgi:cytidylate kinase